MVVVGLDVGTSNIKAVAFDHEGKQIAISKTCCELITNEMGQAESDPNEIWQIVKQTLSDLQKQLDEKIEAIGLSTAMHSLALTDDEGQFLTKFITWADTRAGAILSPEVSQKLANLSRESGVPVHPMTPLVKLTWLKHVKPNLFTVPYRVWGLKSFLLSRLTGEYVVDNAIANASGLFNTKTMTWDRETLGYLKIKSESLPRLVDTDAAFHPTAAVRSELGLDSEAVIIAGASDGVLSTIASPEIKPAKTYAISVGTSAAVRVMTRDCRLARPAKTFTYYAMPDHWVTGAPSNNAGNVMQWVKRTWFSNCSEKSRHLTIERVPVGSNGVMFIPYLYGERAPIWRGDAKGSLLFLNASTRPNDILRACLEGIAFNLTEMTALIDQKKDSIGLISGGMSADAVFDQLIADVTGNTIYLPESVESAALGAAILCLKRLGIIEKSDEIIKKITIKEKFYPDARHHAEYQQIFDRWKRIRDLLEMA